MKIPCLALLFGMSFPAAYAQSTLVTPEKTRSIDSLFRVQFPAASPGVVLLVAQNGTPVFKKAYGMANLELAVPLNTDNRLGIGSMSKQFCAVSMLMLQEEGKLNVKDDIRKFFPGYNTHGKTITIEHLLSHTSGIPSYTELTGFDTLVKRSMPISRLVEFFESKPLIFEPGSNWSYSNSGFVLAALVVEKVSGMLFNDFLQKRIFDPLNMNETSLGDAITIPHRSGEYQPIPKGMVNMETQYDWYWAYGAGQIVSTVNDMLKWDEALYGGKLLKPSTLALAHQSFILTGGQPANYGYGWAVGDLKGKKVVQHGGAIGGFRAGGYRIPEDHIYVVMLSNSGATNTSRLGNGVLSILYDVKPLKENKKAEVDWRSANGTYESLNAGSRLQVNFTNKPAWFYLRADSLKHTLQRTGSPRSNLVAAGKDSLFDATNPWTLLRLQRDGQGIVTGFYVEPMIPSSGPVRFNKKVSAGIPDEKKALPFDSTALAKYSGTFEDNFGNRSRIAVKAKGIYMIDPKTGEEDELEWLGGNQFRVAGVETEIDFATAKDGSVTGWSGFTGSRDVATKKVVDKYGTGL
jgi:D-alanyl-D-alanine carboxypeptidase